MSSSSSDSDEDDTRFREACDPILSKAFNICNDLQQTDSKHLEKHTENGIEDIYDTDHRQSFVLLSKIHQSMKYQQNLPSTKDSSLYQRKITSQQEACNKGHTQPSYLARQLSSILDQNVEFDKQNENLITNESEIKISKMVNDEPKTHAEGFSLLHGVSLSKNDVSQQTSKKIKQRKCTEYCEGLDKKSLSNRCQNVAVSLEWILQKKGVYPWPHPKNIRYLDRYKVKKKHANGKVLLTPIIDMNCQINGGTIDMENLSTKPKVKEKSSLHTKINKKSDGPDLKSKLEIQNKKRKQSRKRGGKKKKNNAQSTGISSSEVTK